MAFLNSDPRDIRRLTDVQLIHQVNGAISDRERSKAQVPLSRAQHLLRLLPPRGFRLAYLVILAVQIGQAIRGLALAITIAPVDRLSGWAAVHEAHLNAMDQDIRILKLLGEMERRVCCSKGLPAR